MARIDKVEAVIKALNKGAAKWGKPAAVIVGYTQSYAIYVHENLAAHHEVGQAKYLEEPARTYRTTIANVITTALKKGADMVTALLLGGLFLQRKSQELCPVDTGALRASAFTRVDE